MFSKILIANRGEIACRVILTCRRLGIATVAVYSEADADAQHVRQADEAYLIGGPRPAESYLRGDAVIAAAKEAGAQAIHPGYGFLSENADFADAVAAAGLVFIGPSGASMRKMGSKAGAKELMAAAGVPVVPGYTGEDQSPNTLSREAARIGFPLMIKAAHGGGGKGMRVVHRLEDFIGQLESCQREAANAFGRDRVLLERYVSSPRHIEIQVFADAHGHTLHLNERECSAQRRYQKVLEESPSPFLTPALRIAMGDAAVKAAQAIDYVNAGTVEFIVDPDGQFYFMEINTRLQVEHPVTELVTGLDLVEWQLRVAAGEPLPLAQDDIRQQGHAIEVRLYAEDPEAGFLPGSGRLERLALPVPAPGIRIDAGVVEGDTVTIFYDPMIAKLIVHGADRPEALGRLRDALSQCDIAGPKSNIAFLERLARHPAVTEGRIDTGYLDRHLDEFMPSATLPNGHRVAIAVAELLRQETEAQATAARSGEPGSPWAVTDGWRLGHAGARPLAFQYRGEAWEGRAHGHGGRYRVDLDDGQHDVEAAQLTGGLLGLRIHGQARRFRVLRHGTRLTLHDGEQRTTVETVPVYRRADAAEASSSGKIVAPMPGRVVLVKARPGDAVVAGQELLVMEAMKMELAVKAPRDGVVAEVRAAAGDFVEADTVLVALE
ncbi:MULTISPECIES: acetyl/propionyl/methylcrotonyl-CoA carboxylase subunit alpha [unclassified Pseudoxanthomonas]|uniref:acetyl-CoA carboxylase biotin carboxylase subunit n=1 Tax=unclassified Pseudoxanthomonas TaxID=2645906 RepID=UPI0008E55BFA|nr:MULTISPECIES: acetyl/propionyl/methylcrotonyl-CoA carboxylase subunit alpha [unclassified Pseudoxanthomonas]PPJ42493.1 acetyl/propionyl/methylcrotonyl-CoA carboxylase subunit alpha [Pseudoxanthomonas sp. KAs_5_3]SFV27108.1 3-methylcrotonoyl-CoA carboxylase, alpha subunit [Pseudoxanthomonas sp. YR558]